MFPEEIHQMIIYHVLYDFRDTEFHYFGISYCEKNYNTFFNLCQVNKAFLKICIQLLKSHKKFFVENKIQKNNNYSKTNIFNYYPLKMYCVLFLKDCQKCHKNNITLNFARYWNGRLGRFCDTCFFKINK